MIASYLFQKCQQKIEENIALIQAKLSDPSSLVTFNATGALVDAVNGGMMGLASFADDYIEKNSDALLIAALGATGLEKDFQEAYDLAMNTFAMVVLAKNNMALKMLQELAKSTMSEISKKDDIIIQLAEKTKELYIALASLVQTPNKWPDHYAGLRQALKLVASVRSDLKLVTNTFTKTDTWLSKQFDGTVTKLEKARDIITPQKNNFAIQKIVDGAVTVNKSMAVPQPDSTKTQEQLAVEKNARDKMHSEGANKMVNGLAWFGVGLSDIFPFPTTAQQWQATIAIGKISGQIVVLLQEYSNAVNTTNALIAAFKSGLAVLSSALPTFFKKFVLNLLNSTYVKVDDLTKGMANSLNGSETSISGPKNGYKPNNLAVSVVSYKWVMDINLILQSYKVLPTKQLNVLNLSAAPVAVYKGCVASLNAMDGKKSGLARLQMRNAEEMIGSLEIQMMAFLLEANNAVIGANVRKTILKVGKSALSRLELGLQADYQIYSILAKFANTPLPEQEELNQMLGGVMTMFENAGMDRAVGLIMGGDYKKLFGLNAREASYVGAALAALALLKNCFTDRASKDKADEIYSDLKSDSDLLNISFSINFDLSIFKNLLDCLKLKDMSKLFSLQELLCGLVNDNLASGGDSGAANASLNKMSSLFKF